MEVNNWLTNKSKYNSNMRGLLKFGVGASAQAIMRRALGEDENHYASYPADYNDLMRCLNVICIFNIDINIMKGTNEYWNKIVDNWFLIGEILLYDNAESEINKLINELTH